MKAWLSIRDVPERRDAFARGFERLGYSVAHMLTLTPKPGDVLAIWSRSGENARAATVFESRGLPVLVIENGYLGVDFGGERWYAISRGQHNGAGTWPAGGPERWDALHVELQPWRQSGETVILPQRGIGTPPVAMPRDWPGRVAHLGRMRQHPGNDAPRVPIEHDLRNAGAVVTWGSGAALQALVMGVPVFYAFPQWIGAPAARPVAEIKTGPRRDDEARLAMFRRMAWAMWRLPEIRSGEALRAVLA